MSDIDIDNESLKSPRKTSYWSSIQVVALNSLVFLEYCILAQAFQADDLSILLASKWTASSGIKRPGT